MLQFLAPLLVFGLVVFVHELGHFLAAKATGVYAPRFSIGFGPALLKKRRGETEYVLALLPLGGYVRMASREDESMAFIEGGPEHPAGSVPTTGANAAGRAVDDHAGDPHRGKDWDPEAMAPFGPKPVPEHRWFESKSLAARLFIMLAGVAMNFLLAIVVYAGSALGYGRPYVPAVVDSVIAGKPAALADFQRGDSVVAVDGAAVREWTDVVTRVQTVTDRPVQVDVVRATGERVRLAVRPQAEQGEDMVTGAKKTVGRIGVAVTARTARESLGVGEALAFGVSRTWTNVGMVGQVVRGLFTRDVAMSNLGGPIQIARTSVQAASMGLEVLLGLIAFLSVNIAVLNLLPIPVLDGGQVLINLIEAAKGSRLSLRTREYVLRAGLAAIALLFVTVMWNDILRLFRDGAQ